MKVAFSGEKEKFSVISGFTLVEQYNETLDSSSIIIRADHRLNLKPYDECCFDNGVCMLINDFVERQESLDIEMYLYTINLMSLTKLLEKIQLPNLMITHSLVGGQKMIYEIINNYLTIYSPKIRVLTQDSSSFETKRLIVNALDYRKYSVNCRDLSFSKPTLRQVLTTLMLQVGCIPKLVKNYTTNTYELQDLDFRKEPTDISTLANTVNYITRSNASDSYVNTLAILGDKMLDECFVHNEILGFRDSEQVLLKQKENLKLQTSFPIYKVNKLILNALVKGDMHIVDMPSVQYRPDGTRGNEGLPVAGNWGNPRKWVGFSIDLVADNNTIEIHKNKCTTDPTLPTLATYYLKLSNVVINELVKEENALRVLKTTKWNDIVLDLENESIALDYEREFVGENNHISIVADLEWTWEEHGGNLKQFACDIGVHNLDNSNPIYFTHSIDITKLCVEYSKRQLLETDFLAMVEAETVEDLAKYIYGTVGYKIGSNVIEGFSQTYSKAEAWWQVDKPYIENILDIVSDDFNNSYVNYEYYQNNLLGGLPRDLFGFRTVAGTKFPYTLIPEDYVPSKNFAYLFFDIEYQALNSARFEISKDYGEINVSVSQLDTSENSIETVNDLFEVEQQKVNRLGNDIITFNQRVSTNENGYNLGDRIFGEYVIFKKERCFYNDFTQIVYSASKNAILQNFFTAIQTKYRAYEYVAYGEAVIRQENIKATVLIDEFFVDNACDKVYLTYYNLNSFISAIMNDSSINKLRYSVNLDEGGGYKTDLSIITAKNNLVFTYIDFDSVSHGVYISSLDAELGGLPQRWYMRSEDFLKTRRSLFFSTTPYTTKFFSFEEATMTDYAVNIHNEPNISLYQLSMLFRKPRIEVSNVPEDGDGIVLYQDQQERINLSAQFEYYTTSKRILWSDLLQSECSLANANKKVVKIGIGNKLALNSETLIDITNYSNIVSFNDRGFSINWSLIPVEKTVLKFYTNSGDIMSVGRGVDNVYVSLLDIKSFKVGSQRNGCLVFDEYEIVKNNVNKLVNRL